MADVCTVRPTRAVTVAVNVQFVVTVKTPDDLLIENPLIPVAEFTFIPELHAI